MTGGRVAFDAAGPVRLLAAIRLANGLAALLFPGVVARRLGGGRADHSNYVLRMFGIRTIFLGLDLVTGSQEDRDRAVRRAPIIHLSDALAALVATSSRHLPLRSGLTAFGISSVNLALSVVAVRKRRH